jgi:lipid II:glycine glycyltransferase (peptidoglycan interpeptide bridge formation enzyme)
MEKSSARGIHFANLGAIWTKGQPKEWKGFTEFKKKFNPHHIILPRSLIRLTFSLRKGKQKQVL